MGSKPGWEGKQDGSNKDEPSRRVALANKPLTTSGCTTEGEEETANGEGHLNDGTYGNGRGAEIEDPAKNDAESKGRDREKNKHGRWSDARLVNRGRNYGGRNQQR